AILSFFFTDPYVKSILIIMISAAIGLAIMFLFGLYSGHARQSKWPIAELSVACVVALPLIALALLYKQHSQGACLQPSSYAPYGSSGVCVRIFTLKNVVIGYAAFGIGLMYRFIGNMS